MGSTTATWVLSVAAFALAMAATPGPNNAMLAASGATFGFTRTVPHILGVSIGFALMIAAVALGAGGVLRALPWLQVMLRWVGAGYLLWLAWRIARARAPQADRAGTAARPFSFVQAALFQWVNPKAWVIAVGVLVTYATGSGMAVAIQAAALALIFVAVTLPSTALWAAVGSGAGRLLRSPRALRAFNVFMAVLLVASLVPMLRE